MLNSSDLLINIHTHQTTSKEDWSIFNLHKQFENTSSFFQYSMGIHPWFIQPETLKDEMDKMKLQSIKKNVLAIGECGLDRLCNTALKLQLSVFTEQIMWANELAKPLIIHCVKAHRETISALQECKNLMPVVFHGFNNNQEIAAQIINNGYYLSFGKSLFNPIVETLFSTMPTDKIFLETDDSDYNIHAIYKQAAKIKNTSIEQLNLQIRLNVQQVFKINPF